MEDTATGATADEGWTSPTTDFWQTIIPQGQSCGTASFETAPYRYGYRTRLVGGSGLVLPLRRLPDGSGALASFIANQASFGVVEAVAKVMAGLIADRGDAMIVGLPTLGLTLAAPVAVQAGRDRYVPLGYSRKFWYDEALSEPVRSITTPGGAKRLYIDPNLVPLIASRPVILVDDAVSSGQSLAAAASLLGRAGARVEVALVAMKQTRRWEAALAGLLPDVRAAFGCPAFDRAADGWVPRAGTMAEVP